MPREPGVATGILITSFYYLIIFTIIYAPTFYVLRYSPGLSSDPLALLIYLALVLALLTTVAYLINQRLHPGPFREMLGLSFSGLRDSLVLSSASFSLPYLILGAIELLRGSNPFDTALKATLSYAYDESRAPPWFSEVPTILLPLYAAMIWSLAGILWFSLVQSFPLRHLSRHLGPWSLPIVQLMSILLYNAPLVTGDWKPDDIVFLGMVFPTVLYLYRNSLGLIVSYVCFFEMPIRAAVLRGWGPSSFKVFLLLQVAWGIATSIAVLIGIANRLGKRLIKRPIKTLTS